VTAVIISIIAGKGAPGASAAALGLTLAWLRPVLLVEADPTGGSLVLGYAAGTDVGGRNLTGVRVAARRSDMAAAIWANVVTLGKDRWLLPGAETTRQAEAIDYPAIAAALAGIGVDVIVDAGRIPAPVRHDALWATADAVLVAMGSTLPAVHAAQTAAAVAQELMSRAGSAASADTVVPALHSVIVGAGRPYSERDIRAAMSDIAPVAGVLAWDPTAAGALVDALPAPRQMASTPLMRSAAKIAISVVQQEDPDQDASVMAAGLTGCRLAEPYARSQDSAEGERDTAGGGQGAPRDRARAGRAETDRATRAHVASAAATPRHSSYAPAAATAQPGDAS
jgi:hypothetical protein